MRGQQDETYLTADVPDDITRAVRVLPGRSWVTVGYSTGGFCAVNLALHHPDRYRAAVSLSGYFSALTDRTTGDLYRGDRAARHANTPLWWLAHRGSGGLALLAIAGRFDVHAAKALAQLRPTAAATHTDLTAVLLPRGGHNFQVWTAATPVALDWAATFLPAPLAPPRTFSCPHPPAPRPAPATRAEAPRSGGPRSTSTVPCP